jgi:uncharacterized caspase-like protein
MKLLLRILVCLCLLAVPAMAQEPRTLKGVALVIGQSKYQHIAALANPDNDAQQIETLLGDLGFEVTGVTDRDARKLARDFERFIEDADGADVALIYYSGHGIEAGGENWLVPVDADPAGIGDGGKGLVALSPVLDELKATVPVTIFLIDACRSNPFPPGALIRKDGKTLEMSTGGLGAPRGFAQVTSGTNESLGTVIGFAAEPGRPALDGEKGANSPYAAAILRHLSAIQGQEFGLVMRMVTEEVYLKTRTQQRPWVNESLRTQLFFGAPVESPKGEDGIITGERRKLLLTIAALPDGERKQVETIAAKDGVPLDTLYGVLASLGATDIPKDPEALAKALSSQADKLKSMLDERKALSTDDPELKRLSDAADKALSEGAIKSARGFLDEAAKRVENSRASIENVEAQAKAKRIANAEIMVKSGDAAELDFDEEAAIKAYAAAYEWVQDADHRLAAKYKTYEADARQNLFTLKGDPAAAEQAIAGYELARGLVSRDQDAKAWAKATNNLANTYLARGITRFAGDDLDRAVALYREALGVFTRDQDPTGWSITQSNLGIALQTLGERGPGVEKLLAARDAYQAALKAVSKDKDPLSWASAKLNMASVQTSLSDRTGETAKLHLAVSNIEQALAMIDKTTHPLVWARGQNNLGAALRMLGAAEGKTELLHRAEAAYRDALTVFSRDRTPVDWASANGNLGIALSNLGVLEGNNDLIAQSIDNFRLALEETRKDDAPVTWSNYQNNLGIALQAVGLIRQKPEMIVESVAALRASLEVRTRDNNPALWADTQALIGQGLGALTSINADNAKTEEAIAAYRQALEVFTPSSYRQKWISTSSSLAMALQGRGIMESGDASLLEAQAIYDAVLKETPRDSSPADWASSMKNIAVLQFMLGTKHGKKEEVEASIRSFDAALEEYQRSGTWIDRMMINSMRSKAVEALALFK